MKKRYYIFLPLLAFLILCACDGRNTQASISAQDPITGRVLTLDIPSQYSPGDFDASGGCSFSSSLDFQEMIERAEANTQVTHVEVFQSYEQFYPYQHAGIFVEENGQCSVFYLEDDCFYGMKAEIIKFADDATGFELLFPYHLVSDLRLSPVEGVLLEGIEYSCVASEDIRSDFQHFYQLIRHYEISPEENGFSLLTKDGAVLIEFVDHAGLTFVSAALKR